jgi:hypothetical protein
MSGIGVFAKALQGVSSLFINEGVPYMIIGGLANAIWGHPRATLDIDVTIWALDDQVEAIIALIEKKYKALVDSPTDFVAKTRVLPVQNSEGLRIDFIFGALPFEKDAIDRAVEKKVGNNAIRFCSAEDLILFKIISERYQDLEDVRGILRVQKDELDFQYLEPRIEELASLLEKPGIKTNWNNWKKDVKR